MIFPNDFNSLVNYFSFCMWLFHTATCFTVIIFRRKMPISQNPRLFKVPIILPYLISLIGCYLIAVPFFQVFIWSFSTQFSTFLNSTFSQEFDIGYIFALGWILFGYLLNISIQKVSCLGWFSLIYRGYHIIVYNLVIGWHTLECNIWFWVRPHNLKSCKSVAVLCGSTLGQMLHSNEVEPKTKCCTLMCVIQWPIDTV